MRTIIAKGSKINRLRITQSYSIRGLANKADLNSVTIQKIENQKVSPNPSTVIKICKALNVEFDDLFELVEKEGSINVTNANYHARGAAN